MARGDAPTVWSDTSNIRWKANIPGRGHSTPVIWGDKIFLTTAIPTGKPAPAQNPPQESGNQQSGDSGTQQRRTQGDTGPQAEHKFEVLCLNRKTGKLLWQATAKVAVPTKVTIALTAASLPIHRLRMASTFTPPSARAASIATTSTEN
jgi:hypothetical protein